MLLLREKEGTEDGKPPERRRADLKGAAWSGEPHSGVSPGPVHHVREQHGGGRVGAPPAGVKCRA